MTGTHKSIATGAHPYNGMVAMSSIVTAGLPCAALDMQNSVRAILWCMAVHDRHMTRISIVDSLLEQ